MDVKKIVTAKNLSSLSILQPLYYDKYFYIRDQLLIARSPNWSYHFTTQYLYLKHYLDNGIEKMMDENEYSDFLNEQNIKIISLTITDYKNFKACCHEGMWKIEYEAKMDKTIEAIFS